MNNFKRIETKIEGLYIIEPRIFGDNRGWFMESYSKRQFEEIGLKVEFLQDNHSYSESEGILRGLHFQNNPMAQTKLVRCVRGKILDVAIDLRKGSPTYKQWVSVELSESNKRMLFIPKGFAHGFLTISSNVEVQYKVDEYYSPKYDRNVRYDDPDIGVDWNLSEYGITKIILSDKDRNAPLLKDSDCNF